MSQARYRKDDAASEVEVLTNDGVAAHQRARTKSSAGLIVSVVINILFLIAIILFAILYASGRIHCMWNGLQNGKLQMEKQSIKDAYAYKKDANKWSSDYKPDKDTRDMFNYVVSPCRNFYQASCSARVPTRDEKWVNQVLPLSSQPDVIPTTSVDGTSFGIFKSFNEVVERYAEALNYRDGWFGYLVSDDYRSEPEWVQKILHFNRLCRIADAYEYYSDHRPNVTEELEIAREELRTEWNRYVDNITDFFVDFYMNYSIQFPSSVSYVGEHEGQPLYLFNIISGDTIFPPLYYDNVYVKDRNNFKLSFLRLFEDDQPRQSGVKRLIEDTERYFLNLVPQDATSSQILKGSDVLNYINKHTGHQFMHDDYLRGMLQRTDLENVFVVVAALPKQSMGDILDNFKDKFRRYKYEDPYLATNGDPFITYLAIRKIMKIATLAADKSEELHEDRDNRRHHANNKCFERLQPYFPILSYWLSKNPNKFKTTDVDFQKFQAAFTDETVHILSYFNLTAYQSRFANILHNLTIKFGTPADLQLDYVYKPWYPNFKSDEMFPALEPYGNETMLKIAWVKYRSLVLEYLRFNAKARLDPSRALLYQVAPLYYNSPFFVSKGDAHVRRGVYFGDRFLMSPFIDDVDPFYMDIGRLGMLMGHELAHVLFEYFQDNMKDFVDTKVLKQFLSCVVYEYTTRREMSTLEADYDDFDDTLLIRLRYSYALLQEGFADQVGLLIAYNVYKKHYMSSDNIKEGLYSRQALFFYAVGTSPLFCNAPESTFDRVTKHLRSVIGFGQARLNSLMRSAYNFNVTFNCKPNDNMNRIDSPVAKCVSDILIF